MDPQSREEAAARLEPEYQALLPLAEVLRSSLTKEIATILERANIALAFPIQSRVKSWQSIAEKLQRVPLSIKRLTDLQDIVGLRIVLQFRRDVGRVCDLIADNVVIVNRYDTQKRLREDQFGYSSIHIVATLKDEWLAVPTFALLAGIHAEIQIRTTAQHIWASAAQVLQYKQEQSVPAELRRSIYRVSALLETIDLEFERLLTERDAYRQQLLNQPELPTERLNVDLLEKTLDDVLPEGNKSVKEDYGRLLVDLMKAGVQTRDQLLAMYDKHRNLVLKREAENVARNRRLLENGETVMGTTEDRARKGVYFSHAGLIRIALRS